MTGRTPVVVLRSNDVCFLGIVRSCVSAGGSVIAVTFTWPGAGPWFSERSAHISETHSIPNPFRLPEQAAEAMTALGAKLAERFGTRLLVLGSSDTNLMFLADNKARLLPYFRFMGDRALSEGRFDLLHKGRCAQVLEKGGVITPLTRAVSRTEEIESAVAEMRYPCVYKPAVKDYGQTFYSTHGGHKAISVTTPDHLRQSLQQEVAAGFELVVQEKVAFSSMEDEIPFYLYADASGTIRQAATAIKEKTQPHPFGTATVLRLSYHPELLDHARAVVRALEYRGILMIEFIRDRHDGQWKVIEVNPRPWLFVDFFRRSGLNYLKSLLEDRDGRMPQQDEVATPDLGRRAPVHISLPPACGEHFEGLGRKPTIGDAVEWLSKIEGPRQLTYLDPGDPAPGEAELMQFASDWDLAVDPFVRAIESLVSDV